MREDVRSVKLGAALVNVINVCNTQGKLSDMMAVPESEWRPLYPTGFDQMGVFSGQCITIRLPGSSVLVDATAYEPDTPYTIPDYQPPPGLLEQLAAVDVRPEEIDHVIITHGHWDHFNATTVERNGRYEPSFPNARHYLGRADWESTYIQDALKDPNSLESRTLAILADQGLLELVEGNRDLGGGLQIMSTPGETLGHQILRVESEGQTLYCLGDLYHHLSEVEHPSWTARWAEDVDGFLASRQALAETALAEDALLVATHIFGIGRLQPTAGGVTWVEA